MMMAVSQNAVPVLDPTFRVVDGDDMVPRRPSVLFIRGCVGRLLFSFFSPSRFRER